MAYCRRLVTTYFGGRIVTNSILKIFAAATVVLTSSGAFAEILASQAAECKITTPAVQQPTVRDLTQMTCRYECAERVRSEFSQTVTEIPAGVSCLWDGVDKTREFLIDQNVLIVALPQEPATPEPEVPSTPVERTSLASPYTYTNKPGKKSAKKLAKNEKSALKDGVMSAAETEKLRELEKIAHTFDVADRTDAMESAIEEFEGTPQYDDLVKHLKSVQELEHVLARDGKMSASEAKRLSSRLLRLEARVAVASGGGLDEKRAVALDAFQRVRKAKLLTKPEIEEVKGKFDAFNTRRSAALTTDAEIDATERAELLTMLNEILEYIREKRDAKTSVEDFAAKAKKRIEQALKQKIISVAQSKKLLEDLDAASKNADKAEALKSMRQIVNRDLMAKASKYLESDAGKKANKKKPQGDLRFRDGPPAEAQQDAPKKGKKSKKSK